MKTHSFIHVGKSALAFIFIFSLTFFNFFTPYKSENKTPVEASVCPSVPIGGNPGSTKLIGTNLYILQYSYNTVKVLDTNTNTVTATITVGGGPYYLTSAGTNLYIVNNSSGDVSVIDTNTNTVTATIPVSGIPYGSIISGTSLYVFGGSSISVIDINTNTVITTIGGVLLQPTTDYEGNDQFLLIGTKIYVIGNQNVYVIDTNTNTVTATIPVGNLPIGEILVGTEIYVFNIFSNDVSVIDTNTNTVTATIPVGNAPFSGISAGIYVYVINQNSGSLSVIDTNTKTVVNTINFAESLSFGILHGDYIYLVSDSSSNIFVFNTNTNTITEIETFFGSGVVFMDSVGQYIYLSVSNGSSGNVIVLDAGNNTIIPDLCKPILLSAEVISSRLFLTYDEILSGSYTPSVTSFSVLVNDFPVEILSIEIENEKVILNLKNSVVFSDRVTVSYVIPVSNPTQDFSENKADAFSNVTAENNSENCGIIDIGSAAFSMVKVGNTLYATTTTDEITAFNTTTRTLIGQIPISTTDSSFIFAVDGYLYVSGETTDVISVIDTTTNTEVDTILGVAMPYFPTLVGTDLYFHNNGSGDVSVVDTNTNTVTATINVGNAPWSSVLVGTDLYISNSDSDVITIVDTTTNTVKNSINTGVYSYFSTLVGTNIYINDLNTGEVVVLDTGTNTISETITVGTSVFASTLVGANLYVNDIALSKIFILNTGTNEVDGFIDTPINPFISFLDGDNLYIRSYESSEIMIIDTTTNNFLECPIIPTDDPEDDEEDGVVTLSHGSTGTTVNGRFRNLVNMGKIDEAYQLLVDFPHMFTTEQGADIPFCDGYVFNDNMKRGDLDGKYSVYNKGFVGEISDWQFFVNRLFIIQYQQASGPVDGIFGPLTEIGVYRTQGFLNKLLNLDKDLALDGIVGPFTRGAVEKLCKNKNIQ